MRIPRLVFVAAVVVLVLGGPAQGQPAGVSKPKLNLSIKPQHVTDALHAIIKAHREVYSDLIFSTNNPAVPAPAGQKQLPSPCEWLRLGSHAVASKGVEYSYVLRSVAPINRRNLPETETERKGLQFVTAHPESSFGEEEILGGRWYYTAVYPDVAVSASCAQCHNQRSPGKKFKVGDVIGGLVVRIALEL